MWCTVSQNFALFSLQLNSLSRISSCCHGYWVASDVCLTVQLRMKTVRSCILPILRAALAPAAGVDTRTLPVQIMTGSVGVAVHQHHPLAQQMTTLMTTALVSHTHSSVLVLNLPLRVHNIISQTLPFPVRVHHVEVDFCFVQYGHHHHYTYTSPLPTPHRLHTPPPSLLPHHTFLTSAILLFMSISTQSMLCIWHNNACIARQQIISHDS